MQNYCTITESQNNLYWKDVWRSCSATLFLAGQLRCCRLKQEMTGGTLTSLEQQESSGALLLSTALHQQDFSIGGEVQLVTLEWENYLCFPVVTSKLLFFRPRDAKLPTLSGTQHENSPCSWCRGKQLCKRSPVFHSLKCEVFLPQLKFPFTSSQAQ